MIPLYAAVICLTVVCLQSDHWSAVCLILFVGSALKGSYFVWPFILFGVSSFACLDWPMFFGPLDLSVFVRSWSCSLAKLHTAPKLYFQKNISWIYFSSIEYIV